MGLGFFVSTTSLLLHCKTSTHEILKPIYFKDLSVNFDDRFALYSIDWEIQPDQNWMIAGSNGAGKSALAAVLTGAGDITQGEIDGVPEKIGVVSFEAQADLITAELRKDDADILDVISLGTPVREILSAVCTDNDLADKLTAQFGLTPLIDRAFRKLSTGESRKVMLVRALACEPDLLVLDEPFDGLDENTLEMLQQHLKTLVGEIPMVLVLNRFDECPDFITDIAYVADGKLHHTIKRSDHDAFNDLYQLLHLATTSRQIPLRDASVKAPVLSENDALVRLSNVSIKYGDTIIFENLNWTIEPNQHWQLSGPNGSGKTNLLSLITGDHPQCYTNDIFVFGFQRGNGESIWEIKQHIGYVSTALQWEYRVSASLRNVIVSGFYDSIGMYTKSSDAEKNIADQWLALLGLEAKADEPFNKLSYGDQRLLLIARAMVKHPPLLILDEPCLGLDEINRQVVLALIEKICAGSESSVIYVNHHPEDKIKGIDNFLTLV
ncbi:MAG: molybdate transport system ATP-binding protein [Parvicella sp.]